jgi:hypothetical protein
LGNGDLLFIQPKLARQSVLELYAGASPYAHAGQRVVVGQLLIQAAGSLFLGWYLKSYATLCGRALARARARSSDAAVLMGYLGKSETFEDALAAFALAYARQTERDHTALLDATVPGASKRRWEHECPLEASSSGRRILTGNGIVV